MSAPRAAARLLIVVLLSVVSLAACGDDSSTSTDTLTGDADGPVIRITVDDPGWSVATPGFDPATGDVEVQVVNDRGAEVDVWAFLAPAGYEAGDPLPGDAEPVLEETVSAGGDVQVTATFDEPGDYAILVDPLTAGDAQRIGQGITVVDG